MRPSPETAARPTERNRTGIHHISTSPYHPVSDEFGEFRITAPAACFPLLVPTEGVQDAPNRQHRSAIPFMPQARASRAETARPRRPAFPHGRGLTAFPSSGCDARKRNRGVPVRWEVEAGGLIYVQVLPCATPSLPTLPRWRPADPGPGLPKCQSMLKSIRLPWMLPSTPFAPISPSTFPAVAGKNRRTVGPVAGNCTV
ncbi:MAG: hypothetical protein QOK12_4601 [Mycobacterium sp.]|nr:hypothetical protein [Mycobacterium sp.]